MGTDQTKAAELLKSGGGHPRFHRRCHPAPDRPASKVGAQQGGRDRRGKGDRAGQGKAGNAEQTLQEVRKKHVSDIEDAANLPGRPLSLMLTLLLSSLTISFAAAEPVQLTMCRRSMADGS